MITDKEFDPEIMEALTGRTFQVVLSIFDDMQIETKLETRQLISECLLGVCRSIDNDKIEFKEDADKAMLYVLMTATLHVFFDGKAPKSSLSVH